MASSASHLRHAHSAKIDSFLPHYHSPVRVRHPHAYLPASICFLFWCLWTLLFVLEKFSRKGVVQRFKGPASDLLHHLYHCGFRWVLNLLQVTAFSSLKWSNNSYVCVIAGERIIWSIMYGNNLENCRDLILMKNPGCWSNFVCVFLFEFITSI